MKMRLIFFGILMIFVLTQCKEKDTGSSDQQQKSETMEYITNETVNKTVEALINEFGKEVNTRGESGVKRVANLWNEEDGTVEDFEKFCLENFISSDKELDLIFEKLSSYYEIIWGYFNKMSVDLKMPLHLDVGDLHKVDYMFGGYNPGAHVTEDLFKNKIAFIVMLNFPFYTLEEKAKLGKEWTSKQWAYARLGDLYSSRVPAELIQKVSESLTNSDTYISEYNIYMGKLKDKEGNTLFADDLKLITHWGLRDELKSHYNTEEGLKKQNLIFEVMKKIINQEIPESVINSDEYEWHPYDNKLFKDGKEISFETEPNTRYRHLLNNFNAMRDIDQYSPLYPTYIKRKFDQAMEISQEEVEKLFVDFISSPQVKEVGKLISKRLGRKLEPYDIWYDGFKSRSSIGEDDLNKKVNQKYPSKDAFEADLPNILQKLGFTNERSQEITSKIIVDASRGAGHAWGAEMKTDKARLRTRIGENGMNYKGYNIAIHEFGHNVEQTITLHDVDHYLINGVPNTAFSEALAFVFQKRDLELLGIKDDNPNKEHLAALDNFWSAYEIMGVSLVDMNVWKWLYEHPEANAEELKNAVIKIARDVWNEYYADVFGIKDQDILAVYSHMIDYPLYLPAYPLGHLIEFQLEKQIMDKDFATEVQRIFQQGKIIPQLWMNEAVGMNISGEPMIEAVDEALKVVD